MNRRLERLQKLIPKILGELILREEEFPAGTLLTITGVEVSPKLDRAEVLVSVLPESAAKGAMLRLRADAPRLQRLLAGKINIRPMPMISFSIDKGGANAAAVEKVLLAEDNKRSGGAQRGQVAKR